MPRPRVKGEGPSRMLQRQQEPTGQAMNMTWSSRLTVQELRIQGFIMELVPPMIKLIFVKSSISNVLEKRNAKRSLLMAVALLEPDCSENMQ